MKDNEDGYHILLVAYALSPTKGSEPKTGWKTAISAARHNRVTVIVRKEEWQEDVEKYLESQVLPSGMEIVYVSLGYSILDWLRKYHFFRFFVYRYWLFKSHKTIEAFISKGHIDLIHHITLTTFRVPGRFYEFSVPCLFGPVGGLQNYPYRMMLYGRLPGMIKEFVRGILNSLEVRFNRRFVNCLKWTKVIISNSDGIEWIKRVHAIDCELALDIGTETKNIRSSPKLLLPGEKLRILWIGAHLDRKALHVLLFALRKVIDLSRIQVDVYGSGGLTNYWQKLAGRLGVASSINWVGNVPFQQVQTAYAENHLLAFTSLRDSGGNVVTEALENALPVIGLDHNGFQDAVTEKCGFKIPVTSFDGITTDIAKTIDRILLQPTLVEAKSQGAIERAKQITWDERAKIFQGMYDELIGAPGKQACN